MKLKKTNKNKITFLSRQQNDISLDMKLIKEELLKNNKNRVPVLALIYYILFYKLKIAYHKLGGNICK